MTRTTPKRAEDLAVGDRIVRSYYPFADAAARTKVYRVDAVNHVSYDGKARVHVMAGALSLTFRPGVTVQCVLPDEEADE